MLLSFKGRMNYEKSIICYIYMFYINAYVLL